MPPSLTYSGIPISPLETHAVFHENQYDATGLDYLGTKLTFDVTGLVNPAAMSFTRPVGQPAQQQAGQAAPATIASIRDALAIPRQTLVYSANGTEIVRSPAVPPGGLGPYPCDVTGGPTPLRPVEILGVHGDGKSIRVRFVVSTVVNESYLATPTKPPYLVSNRWDCESANDECAFEVRTYRGRAVFRADVLNTKTVPAAGNRLAVPDDLRDYFAAFFIPRGFQRQQVWVRQDATGYGVEYQVVDVQKPVTLTDFRAQDVEVVQIDGVQSKGVEEMFWDNFFGVGEDLAGLGGVIGGGGLSFPGLGGRGGIDLGALIRPFFNEIHRGLDNIPRASTRLIITAKGNPGSNRRDLAKLCYVVLGQIVSTAGRALSTSRAYLTQDKTGKYVRLEVDINRGPIASIIVAGTCSIPSMLGSVPADDGIDGVTSSTPGVQPPYPGDGGVRGTALEGLVTQALLNPYQAPPPPVPLTNYGQGMPPQ